MGIFKRAWRREERLWKVFWLLYVLPAVPANVLNLVGMEDMGMVVTICLIPFNLYVLVLLWKNSWNAHWKIWGYLIRGVLLLIPIGIVVGVILVWMDLVAAAEQRACLAAYEKEAGMPFSEIDRNAPEVRAYVAECIQSEGYKEER